MRRLVVLGLLAACRTPSHVAAPVVDNAVPAAGPVRNDADALARWRALHLTGADYQQRLADVAADDAPAMARALLRAGDFACTNVIDEAECGDDVQEYAPLDPKATFDDPCLRRALALWSIDQLSDARGVEDALAGLVAMRGAETELQPAAFTLVGDDTLRLRLMAAADPTLADQQAALLTSPDALRAAAAMHLASAVTALAKDARNNHAALLAAAQDSELDETTRLALVDDTLAGDPAADTATTLAELADGDGDCAIAEAAAEALAQRGDPRHLPVRPSSQDAEAHMRALCMLRASSLPDTAARLAAWVDPHGMASIDESYAYTFDTPPVEGEHDGVLVERDGDLIRTTTQVGPADVDVADLASGIYAWTCSGLTCSIGDGERTLTFAKAGGSLVIASSSQTHEDGCGC